MGDLFNQLFITPILNLLIVFYKAFTTVNTPFAFGFAIITLTFFIRLLLSPLTKKQLQSAKKMAKLQPQLAKLQKKYKNDKAKLQQEQLRLYKEAGVNPAAGCLPIIIQIPLFLALFRVFSKVLANGGEGKAVEFINSAVYTQELRIVSLDLTFFGIDLITKPSDWRVVGMWLLAIPLITGLLQYAQTKMMLASSAKKEHVPKEKEKGDDKKKDGEEDMSQTMQKQMALISPVMIGFFAYSFPIGLALYWNTFTVFGILQQYFLGKTSKK